MALQIGRCLLEEFRSRGEEYTTGDFFKAVLGKLKGLEADAVEVLAVWVTDKVDEEASRPPRPWDQAFAEFGDFDLCGVYKLGDNRRIAKESARLDHIQAALSLDSENVAAVQEAHARKIREFEKLRPYLERPGTNKKQAVLAYLADHPNSGETV
jgi:hypothetical protein